MLRDAINYGNTSNTKSGDTKPINFCLKVKFFKGFYDNFWNRKPTKCDLCEKYQQ